VCRETHPFSDLSVTHASVAFTLSNYGHISSEDGVAAAESVGALVYGAGS